VNFRETLETRFPWTVVKLPVAARIDHRVATIDCTEMDNEERKPWVASKYPQELPVDVQVANYLDNM
jgi:hypothetical protein